MRTPATHGSAVARPLTETELRVLAPPVGTRDLLPPEAADRRALTRGVADTLERHGYALVTTPPFELVETVERGLGGDPRETLRFVDPETGEVSVFRPDLTVQVARLAASGLRERPPPYRLYYDGHVLRARRGRARRQRQIAQIGAECIGIAGARGDAEVISLASRALSNIGLEHRVEIAIVPMVRDLCARLPTTSQTAVAEAFARKDRAGIERALAASHGDASVTRALAALEDASGSLDVLDRVRGVLEPLVASHVRALDELCDALVERGLAPSVRLDLGEVRGFDYYTGPSFALLAEGPGEPLGGGGRYDDLLGRFGRDLPASGFAVDLEHLARALALQGRRTAAKRRASVCVVGGDASMLDAIRATDVDAAQLEVTADDAVAYAAAWQLRAAIVVENDLATIHWTGAGSERCGRTDVAQRLARAERETDREDQS